MFVSRRSSDESPSSPSIEFEVKRTMEDMILSASTSIWVSGFKILFSTKLPVSASPSDESDFSARAAEDDGGECLKPNDISNLVNNCLAERRPSSWRRSGPELKATGASSEKVSAISDGMRGRVHSNNIAAQIWRSKACMRWSETLGHQMPADYSPPDRYPAIRPRLGGNRMQFNQSDGS